MKNLSLLTLIFAVTFTFFFLLLIFFRIPFPPYPLISYQNALDLLTPLVLIPFYWLLFRSSGRNSSLAEELAFMLIVHEWRRPAGVTTISHCSGRDHLWVFQFLYLPGRSDGATGYPVRCAQRGGNAHLKPHTFRPVRLAMMSCCNQPSMQ